MKQAVKEIYVILLKLGHPADDCGYITFYMRELHEHSHGRDIYRDIATSLCGNPKVQ